VTFIRSCVGEPLKRYVRRSCKLPDSRGDVKILKDFLFSSTREASDASKHSASLANWFEVIFDEHEINLSVNPPKRLAWQAQIKWNRIIRVCFKAGDLYVPDEIYIFTEERPESYLLPLEASGGSSLWNEIIRRRLFDAELAIEAMRSTDRVFCWPPLSPSQFE